MKMFLILAVLFVSLGAQVHAADEINTGKQPEAGLVQGDDIEADDDIPAKRAFYGTTSGGGSTGNGTIFQVTDSGEVTTARELRRPKRAEGILPGRHPDSRERWRFLWNDL